MGETSAVVIRALSVGTPLVVSDVGWFSELPDDVALKAAPDERYGDVEVDTEKAHAAYKEWMEQTRPAPGPDGLRRPLWFDRPLRPVPDAYRLAPRREGQ